jgi:hypothetical protein
VDVHADVGRYREGEFGHRPEAPEAGVREAGVREAGVREAGVREAGVREAGVREDAAEQATLDAVLARMTARLDELRRAGDDRRIFLAVYATMTGAIHRGVHEGRFMDPTWTEVLTARFATLYFDAEAAWEADDPCCPRPWCAAFAAAGGRRISAVEHALLGINAHIVYDLPFAVASTMVARGDVRDGRLLADTLVRRRHDYEVVNHILAETVEAAQAVLAVESRTSEWFDRLTLRFDSYAAELMLRASRTQGWHNALALAVARDEAERDAVRQHLDRVACGYVERIDLTQLLPGTRARTLASRWRPPFAAAIADVTH